MAPTCWYIFALRSFTPSTLGRPREERASTQNDACQHQPGVNVGGDEARTTHADRRDHRKILRAGVAAVGGSAPLCIENARRAHPAQRNDPKCHSKKDGREQTGNNGDPWNPPREQVRVRALQPIVRALDDIVRRHSYHNSRKRHPSRPNAQPGCQHSIIAECQKFEALAPRAQIKTFAIRTTSAVPPLSTRLLQRSQTAMRLAGNHRLTPVRRFQRRRARTSDCGSPAHSKPSLP